MTLPASGQISMSDINTEMGRASNHQFSLNDSDVRALAGIPYGSISLNDFHGKSNIHNIRPNYYSITSVTGGSINNPADAYDGSGGTYSTITHGIGGVWPSTEAITYFGFGSGTHTGTLYISCDGSLQDTAITAYAQLGMKVNGSDIGSSPITSTGSTPVTFSATGGSAISIYMPSTDLASLAVEFYAMGGRVGPIGDGDNANGSMNVYDIVFIY